jgi:hypothetical protein
MSEQNCGTCRFFKLFDQGQRKGLCRRHAPRPKIGLADPDEVYGYFPIMVASEWCGEWEFRIAPTKENVLVPLQRVERLEARINLADSVRCAAIDFYGPSFDLNCPLQQALAHLDMGLTSYAMERSLA